MDTGCRVMSYALILGGFISSATVLGASTGSVSPDVRRQWEIAYGKLPLHFEANQGQTDSIVKFLARGKGYSVFLRPAEVMLSVRKSSVAEGRRQADKAAAPLATKTAAVRIRLMGSQPAPEIVGERPLPGKSHYLLGNDPRGWRTHIPHYARVRYRGVYPGIDLIYYGHQGRLEYDFVVAPGADPKQIHLDIQGAERLYLDAAGNLVLVAQGRELIQQAPKVYQRIGDVERLIPGRYVLTSNRLGFEVAAYDTAQPLVIDPVLNYSTYLGASNDELGQGIAVDRDGQAYVTGGTTSTDFPTGNPVQGELAGGTDAFVLKLTANGQQLVYSTFVGGDGFDIGLGIAIDSKGRAYVTGATDSTNFPTVNALRGALAGASDAFVARLTVQGTLAYSTYLGGSGFDRGSGIAVTIKGRAHVTGVTESADFPTMNPQQQDLGGNSDAFVAKLTRDGKALVYSTYLGGGGIDEGLAIAVRNGQAHVTGGTASQDFPTANPLQSNFSGNRDAFVAKLKADGKTLVYSTYLGGSDFDEGLGVAVDIEEQAYITGATRSPNFPTVDPLQESFAGDRDAFVAKLKADGKTLVYSTYLGGSDFDEGTAIAVRRGRAFVIGSTASPDFPIADSLQGFGGNRDVFVTKLKVDGQAFAYSTYLGGSGFDDGLGIAVNRRGRAYVTGETDSQNFPTARPLLGSFNGGNDDAFIVKIK
ncbi:MAG TPA: SBBP repeat-containing protein [Gammaproteobacteria bacterium]|nr:SBBP repeat-containing protein [Gammaproteobacteria bacterium]